MSEKRSYRRQVDSPPGPTKEEEKMQRAVLGLALDAHPCMLDIGSMKIEMTGSQEDSPATEEIDAAVAMLVHKGLLHCHGGVMGPTEAARHFDGLAL